MARGFVDTERIRRTQASLNNFLTTQYESKDSVFTAIDALPDVEKIAQARDAIRDQALIHEAMANPMTLEQILLLEENPDVGATQYIFTRFIQSFSGGQKEFDEFYKPVLDENRELRNNTTAKARAVYLLLWVAEIMYRDGAFSPLNPEVPSGSLGIAPANDKNGNSPTTTNNPSRDTSVSSPANSASGKNLGGVDFRALPIVAQPLTGINMPLGRLDNFRADPEWQEIQNMVNTGIIPSGQRIKDYLQSCCKKKELNGEIGLVLNCIADILRIEEERVSATDPEFKDMLVLLESGKSADELTSALNKINFQSH